MAGINSAEIMEAGLRRPNGRIKWYLPITKPAQFKEQEIPLSPYLLGCLLADGIFGPQAMFSSQEDDILEAVAEELPDSCKLVYTGYGTDYSIVRAGGGRNNEVHSILRFLGLWGNGRMKSMFRKSICTTRLRIGLHYYKDYLIVTVCTKMAQRLSTPRALKGLEDVVFRTVFRRYSVCCEQGSQYTYKGEKEKDGCLGGCILSFQKLLFLSEARNICLPIFHEQSTGV